MAEPTVGDAMAAKYAKVPSRTAEVVVYQDRKTDPEYMISYDSSGEWLVYRVKLPMKKLKEAGI